MSQLADPRSSGAPSPDSDTGAGSGVVEPTLPVIRPGAGRIAALGFGTAVAMWAVAYVAFMGPGLIAGELLFGVMLIALFAGGFLAGRTGTGTDGFRVGAVAAAVNMLLVGSLFGGKDAIELGTAGMWVGGLWITSLVLAGAGGFFGARRAVPTVRSWPGVFALVAAGTVFLLLITGGLVTGLEAGLAVPDWPNSFGHNMLLYPLSEMKGGVYYEHAHRLYGMLVGLTTITLVYVVWRSDRRRWVKWIAVAALAMVCIQGLMGGLRVTGRLTLSAESSELAPSIALAIVHGVFGQVVFATLALLAAFTSTAWTTGPGPAPSAAAKGDRTTTVILVVAIVLQLVLGACYRHLQTTESQPMWALHGHLTVAALVATMALVVGLRAWGTHGESPVMRRLGLALVALTGFQIVLGIAALAAVLLRSGPRIPVYEVVLTSAHQATGALVLATGALCAVWVRRLFVPAPGSAA
ncbi:MAG: COX15/CtaA family protein [Phycisphaerales bacterium]|nr:COX15/CtaA family protein [Phycisphaerales bacterium]